MKYLSHLGFRLTLPAFGRGQRRLDLRSFSSSRRQHDTFGFIGLGAMGYPMAKNLRAKLPTSDLLIVYDINTKATQNFLHEANNEGWQSTVKVADSINEAARLSNTIITVLPEPSHVQTVYKSILNGTLPPVHSSRGHSCRFYIDCSTIDPNTSASVGSWIRESQPEDVFIDAPMSGGVVGARAGTLTFMLGAPESAMDRATSVLSAMGKRIFRLGDPGAGLSGKLANNYLLAISNIATCEAMNLGTKLGLDPKALAELINTSSGRCWSSEVNNPIPGISKGAPAERDYDGGFGVSLMKKDLRLAMAAAHEARVRMTLGNRAQDVYDQVEKAEPGKDFAVVYRWLNRASKV